MRFMDHVYWKIAAILVVIALALWLLTACQAQKADLIVTIPDTGKSDCILIQSDGHTMMIDTGLSESWKKIQDTLESASVHHLDYLVLTHFDKDHIGSADQVITNIGADTIIQPDYIVDSPQYDEYISALAIMNQTPVILKKEMTFTLGRAKVRLLPAENSNYEDENNYSIITELEYGACSFLFMGDAVKERIKEYLNTNIDQFDYIKMPHHGDKNKMTDDLVDQIQPEIAVITCSLQEPASDKTVELLQDCGADIYYTDQGDVFAVCDGEKIDVTQD